MTLYLGAFLLCLFIGMPVAISLGMASLIYLVGNGDLHLLVAFPQRMVTGIDNFVLLTIPFFILAGSLMNAANLTQQIVRFAQMLIGRVRGGLAAVSVVASMMFSGISGAATAEASAIGSIMIPAMRKDGYKGEYAAALGRGRLAPGPPGSALARPHPLRRADRHLHRRPVPRRHRARLPAVRPAARLCAVARAPRQPSHSSRRAA